MWNWHLNISWVICKRKWVCVCYQQIAFYYTIYTHKFTNQRKPTTFRWPRNRHKDVSTVKFQMGKPSFDGNFIMVKKLQERLRYAI